MCLYGQSFPELSNSRSIALRDISNCLESRRIFQIFPAETCSDKKFLPQQAGEQAHVLMIEQQKQEFTSENTKICYNDVLRKRVVSRSLMSDPGMNMLGPPMVVFGRTTDEWEGPPSDCVTSTSSLDSNNSRSLSTSQSTAHSQASTPLLTSLRRGWETANC